MTASMKTMPLQWMQQDVCQLFGGLEMTRLQTKLSRQALDYFLHALFEFQSVFAFVCVLHGYPQDVSIR